MPTVTDPAKACALAHQEPCRKFRLVHMVTRLSVAGMETVVASLVRAMPTECYESSVWCLEEADVLGQNLRAEGFEVKEFGRTERREITLFFRLAAMLNRCHVDVLHCHDEVSWFYGAVAARLSGTPVVVTMHGRRPDISRRHLYEQRVLTGLTRSLVCVSAYLHRQIVGEICARSAKAPIIHNGIPLPPDATGSDMRRQARASLGLPDTSFVVGSVGRLNTVKNLDLFIRAAAEARSLIGNLCVVLIGDGPCRTSLSERAKAVGLDDVIVFAGVRSDVADLLPALDVYVCSSDYEGISLSILEAMAARRSVIATAVGGNVEIIRHGETGILVEKGNCSALAAAIVEIFHNDERRFRLGQQARYSVQADFSIDRMVQDYDRLYRSL